MSSPHVFALPVGSTDWGQGPGRIDGMLGSSGLYKIGETDHPIGSLHVPDAFGLSTSWALSRSCGPVTVALGHPTSYVSTDHHVST